MKKGFDNEKYLKEQTAAILEKVQQFNDKLYLEFGGKLLYDYHAASSLILNATKHLAGLPKKLHLLPQNIIDSVTFLKKENGHWSFTFFLEVEKQDRPHQH